MKKFFAFLLVAAMLLAMCACSGNSNSGSSGKAPLAGVTITEGKLMVGAEIGYPPMEYMDKDGTTPIGFDVEFAQKLAEKLGLELDLINTAWDGIFASLDSNRYDLVISSCSITEERQKNYLMTKPYIANRLVLVTGKDSGIKSPEDLAGHTCATQTETTADYYMRDLQEGGVKLSDYFVYDQVIQCFEELKFGRVEAVLVDQVVASYYIGSDADKFEVVWENSEAEPLGIAMKKGNTQLLDAVEKAIDEMYADGTVKAIAIKYFGSDTTAGVR